MKKHSLPPQMRRQRQNVYSLVTLLVLFILYLCRVQRSHRAFPPLGYDPSELLPGLDDLDDFDASRLLEPSKTSSSHEESHGAANSTLGFGAIVAVSRHGSLRKEGLIWAANLTGLDITIPDQPVWREGDVENFNSSGRADISRGSALAWLGHLTALEWFLDTDRETALIIEDDVDWNQAIRTTQIKRAETAFRSLMLPRIPIESAPTEFSHWTTGPSWELLWLGHCGDDASRDHIISHPHTMYSDATVPPTPGRDPRTPLDNRTTSFLDQFGVPSQTRVIHRSYWPLCTFAYAVTRTSAQRILSTYGSGVAHAYDVALLEACRDNDWECYTISPELFHHTEAASEIALVDQGGKQDKDDVRMKKNPTHNIACTVRDLWVDEDDTRGRKWMKETVRRGRCYTHGTERADDGEAEQKGAR